MWLPYIIISFPGVSTGDTLDELSQFFHLDSSWSVKSINLLNENVYINKHHSVLHTVILGLIFKLGKMLGSFTFGVFIYVVFQVVLLLIIFSFMIKYMKKIKVNSMIIFLSVLFVGLNPTIAVFAICAIKDTPSSIFNLLYVIFLLQIVRNFDSIYKNKLRFLGLIFTILMVLLFRNNGIYTFLLSFPWLFLVYKNKWKKILLTILVVIFMFYGYDKVLLPKFDISDGSIREVLSIPVMQLSRVVHHKSEEFSISDKEIINSVFNFEGMKSFYDPDLADNVKNRYNKDASSKDLKLFFGVWFKYLKKYPIMYIESVVNSTYGYFFPEKSEDEIYLYDFNFKRYAYFDINHIEVFETPRNIFNQLLYIYYKLPFFINKVAYYDWFLLFSIIYIITKKKYKYLVPLSALFAVLLSCFASPVNGSFRYIMPIIFSAPIILSIDYLVYNESKKD